MNEQAVTVIADHLAAMRLEQQPSRTSFAIARLLVRALQSHGYEITARKERELGVAQ